MLQGQQTNKLESIPHEGGAKTKLNMGIEKLKIYIYFLQGVNLTEKAVSPHRKNGGGHWKQQDQQPAGVSKNILVNV